MKNSILITLTLVFLMTDGIFSQTMPVLWETIPTSPLLEITVNDYKMTVQAPVGIEQYFRERKVNPADLSTILNIPENVLKKGNNTILITTKTGNYVVFDHVLFSTAYPLELAQPTAEIKFIAIDAKQALVYGKNRALFQPLILQRILTSVIPNPKQKYLPNIFDISTMRLNIAN